MSRVLVVSPVFHGYWRSVEAALARRGHVVRTCRYDERTPLGKIGHQLTHELPALLDRRGPHHASATRAALDALAWRPDVVVVVKGDVLAPVFWDRLDDTRVPRVTWLFDELDRMGYAWTTLDRVGPVATYSRHDAALLTGRGVATAYVPLAHDVHLPIPDPGGRGRTDEVVFVGARYPRRATMLTALAAAGVPVRVYGRDWSRHPVDVLRTRARPRPPLLAGRDLERTETYAVSAAASAALNVHGEQDGFTMRTFETCGVGAVQLIDRADVSELYEPEREVVVFDGLDGPAGLVEQVARVRSDRAWTDRLRERAVARTRAEHTFDHRVAVLEQMWQR